MNPGKRHDLGIAIVGSGRIGELRAQLAANHPAVNFIACADADAGRLDRDAVGAVLDAAGHARPRSRDHLPAGLSEREVDVLRLVARGFSNRQVAQALSISPRTAEHHVQHVYTKIGVSSRAAAAVFAMEHDLLDRNG